MGSTKFFLQHKMIFDFNLSEKTFLFVCLGGSKPTFSVFFILFRELKNLHITVPFNETHIFNILKLLTVNILIQTKFV